MSHSSLEDRSFEVTDHHWCLKSQKWSPKNHEHYFAKSKILTITKNHSIFSRGSVFLCFGGCVWLHSVQNPSVSFAPSRTAFDAFCKKSSSNISHLQETKSKVQAACAFKSPSERTCEPGVESFERRLLNPPKLSVLLFGTKLIWIHKTRFLCTCQTVYKNRNTKRKQKKKNCI